MFSTSPMIGMPAVSNSWPARAASIRARSCGVDTSTAPTGLCFCIMVSCTSPVPGGMSTTSSSVSPQSASTSWPSALPVIGPRQAMALPGATSWPIDSTGTPDGVATGISLPSRASGRVPDTPRMVGCDGP